MFPCPSKFHTSSHGFTLVELAIALTVIGLLIGGILKSGEMMENARIVKAINQLNAYDNAVIAFAGTYYALPGDIRDAARRVPGCDFVPCTNIGDGNERIGVGHMSTIPGERYAFWSHLGQAGLIPDVTVTGTISYSPFDVFNARAAVNYGVLRTDDAERNFFEISGYTPLRMLKIDEKIDDGMALTGMMIGVTPACRDATTGEYLARKTPATCVFRLEMKYSR